MKRIFSYLLIILLVIFALNNLAYASDAKDVFSGKRPLIIGHLIFPPFFLSGTDNPRGMDADILRVAAKRAGIKRIQFVTITKLTDLIAALKQQKIDVLASGFGLTPERSKLFLLTIPYYKQGGLGVLYDKDAIHYHTLTDLKGHNIAVINGSYPQSWLPKQGFSSQQIKEYDSPSELMAALMQRQVNAIVTNYTYCRFQQYANRNSSLKLDSVLIKRLPIVFAVNKQQLELQQKLNQALKTMWSDGSLYHIKLHYLKPSGIIPSRSL